MKNCVVKDKKLSIVCSGAVVNLTIVPMTFGKLIDINAALPKGKDLSSVMQEPTPLDLAITTYCLLDEESKKTIDSMTVEIDGEVEPTSNAHKLYCMMCESNVTDGIQNNNKILSVIVDQVKDSTSQQETKKKTLAIRLFMMLKKFTTRSARTIHTPMNCS
jgi:hypothetical protein